MLVSYPNNKYNITVQEVNPSITIKQGLTSIVIQQVLSPDVTIQGSSVPATIIPFSFTASANQTSFTLPYSPTTIICLFIMGTAQDALAGDFTLSGNVITLGSSAPTLNAGDLVFGAYQL